MDVKITGVLNGAPGNRRVPVSDFSGQMGDQLANLHHTHTAGVLKHKVLFKCGKIVVISLQIVGNAVAVGDDFLKNHPVMGFDRAPPHPSR